MMMKKNFMQLERIVRGFSNHRRIQIMTLLKADPDMNLRALATACGTNLKTVSAHTNRLAAAGLIMKQSRGLHVVHALTSRGKDTLSFLKTLE